MPNPASVTDVENRWRPLSAQETTNATTFLEDAWVMLKRRMIRLGVTDFEDQITANENDFEAAVVAALANAVLRVMKNPDGLERESIDDYSWSRGEAVADGLLYFTDDELDDLIPGSGNEGRAYKVDLLGDYDARMAE